MADVGGRGMCSGGREVATCARGRAVVGIVVILGCPLLGGCAAIAGDAAYSAAFRTKIEDPSQLPTDELRQLELVQLYNSDQGLSYVSKGRVAGLSCKLSIAPLIPVWVWKPALSELNGKTPEDAAMTQLKIKALKSGGNAVLSPTCTHKDGLDWGNNCFESWMCVGHAIQVG